MSTRLGSPSSVRLRCRAIAAICAGVFGLAFGALPATTAFGGNTSRASIANRGGESNASSEAPSISANGRFVAFQSQANNLVINDTNGVDDIFVHDRVAQQTVRVSVSTSGAQGNSWSIRPAISPDGRYVVFESHASNLVAADNNKNWDVFHHDRFTGITRRVSVSKTGANANGTSLAASVSLHGAIVVFASNANNLVPNDFNGKWDIFAHDVASGLTTRISVASGGSEANGGSFLPAVSNEGRFVTFVSGATNLVPYDRNGKRDVFMHDRTTRVTLRMSVSTGGTEGNDDSGSTVLRGPSISADGRFVAFSSLAHNLVANDTNSTWDIFVHDVYSRKTSRASLSSYGDQSDNWSLYPSLSADGQYVAFQSAASNLVNNDGNQAADVFVRNLRTGVTVRFSVNSRGQEGDGPSARRGTAIAAYGSAVAFESQAQNLTFDDTNAMPDIFVHEFFPLLASDALRIGRTAKIYLYAPNSPERMYCLAAARTSSPGWRVDTRRVPLNFDWLTALSLSTPALFQNFVGILDSNGFASASIRTPNEQFLIGHSLYLSFITLHPSARSGIQEISNALPVRFTP